MTALRFEAGKTPGNDDVPRAAAPDALLAQADQALYQAKAEGRNRIMVATAAAARITG